MSPLESRWVLECPCNGDESTNSMELISNTRIPALMFNIKSEGGLEFEKSRMLKDQRV